MLSDIENRNKATRISAQRLLFRMPPNLSEVLFIKSKTDKTITEKMTRNVKHEDISISYEVSILTN